MLLSCFVLLIIRRQKHGPTGNYDMKVKGTNQSVWPDKHEQCSLKRKKNEWSLSYITWSDRLTCPLNISVW